MFLSAPSPEYLTVHQTVENALNAALQTARPGTLAKDVYAATRKVIERSKYEEYFAPRLGHGVGSEVHDHPYLSATSNTVLEERIVFSIEPGIYLPKKFCVRLGDIVTLTADGPEN